MGRVYPAHKYKSTMKFKYKFARDYVLKLKYKVKVNKENINLYT